MAVPPTIYEWAGGTAAFERLAERLLRPGRSGLRAGADVRRRVSEEHRDHVLAWWVEVMGGPDAYSRELGGYPTMLAHHRELRITPEQRLRSSPC